jgi:hypothetical protein
MKIRVEYQLSDEKGKYGPCLTDFVCPRDKEYMIEKYHYYVTIDFKRYKSCKTYFLEDIYDEINFPKIKDLSYLGSDVGRNKYMNKIEILNRFD